VHARPEARRPNARAGMTHRRRRRHRRFRVAGLALPPALAPRTLARAQAWPQAGAGPDRASALPPLLADLSWRQLRLLPARCWARRRHQHGSQPPAVEAAAAAARLPAALGFHHPPWSSLLCEWLHGACCRWMTMWPHEAPGRRPRHLRGVWRRRAHRCTCSTPQLRIPVLRNVGEFQSVPIPSPH
jgi:hypothetical protein